MQVRGALETLVSALTPINHAKGSSNEVQPALMNTDLLSREAESISLLLSLLVRNFFIQIMKGVLNYFTRGFVSFWGNAYIYYLIIFPLTNIQDSEQIDCTQIIIKV